MKNLKNTVAAASLMAVMAFGAVSASANTGIILTDKTATTPKTCTVDNGGVIQQLADIFNTLTGIILTDRDGLLITDKQTTGCEAKDGIILTDRDGLLITD